jgi:ribosome-associated protein
MIRILSGLSIPDDEVVFTASRSGGPGGQHVNKVSSRITLRFDVNASRSLSPEQKRRIRSKLSTRINAEGILRVIARHSRSQSVNRDAAEERFAELIRAALITPKRRVKTAMPASQRRDRLEEKRHHSRIKRERIWRDGNED